MRRLMTKPTKWRVRPAKTQISLGIRPVWSESSPCAQWVAKDSSFLHADSEGSDQTGRMPRLIWVFAGRTTTLLVLSWGGSYYKTSRTNTYSWAGPWKMWLMSNANNKGADQPVHPHSMISAFVFRCLDSIISLEDSIISLDSIAEISRL